MMSSSNSGQLLTNLLCTTLFILWTIPVGLHAQKLISNQTIDLEQGKVLGRLWNVDGTKAIIVKGIPYAEPPVGPLRFRRPQKKFAWDDTRSGFRSGSPCIQFYETDSRDNTVPFQNQSEDCLFLDLYAPEKSSEEKHPVMFWIHGGSFMANSGDSNIQESVVVQNVVRKGVILVTINYRLGPFGFIVGPQNLKPSIENLGLWDQVEALKWVRDNIEAVGGDPDSVTVIGESAGGASASILALSPVTEGLIHRAIIMSGSIAANWAVHQQTDTDQKPRWAFQNLYDLLSCKDEESLDLFMMIESGGIDPSLTGDPEDAETLEERFKDYDCPFVKNKLECGDVLEDDEEFWFCFLDNVNFDSPDFVALCRLMAESGFEHTRPVFDGELIPYPDADQMLARNPRIPIMTGTAGLEWGSRSYTSKLPQYSKNVSQETIQGLIASTVEMGGVVEDDQVRTKDLIVNEAYYHYFADEHSLTAFDKDTIEVTKKLQELESDMDFVSPCAKEINAYADANQPVYAYSFDKAPENGVNRYNAPELRAFFGMKPPVQKIHERPEKAFHGLDHGYLFSEGQTEQHDFEYATDGDDKELADKFSTMITNFAKHGSPTPFVEPAETNGTVLVQGPNGDYYAYDNTEDAEYDPESVEDWPSYTKQDPHYMIFDSPSKIVDEEFKWPAVKFWNHKVPLLKKYTQSDQSEALKSGSTNFYESQPPEEGGGDSSSEEIPPVVESYRQAWIALWVLIALILLMLLCCLGYLCWRTLCNRDKHQKSVNLDNNEYYDRHGVVVSERQRSPRQTRQYDTDMSSLGTTPTGTMQSSAYSSPHVLSYQGTSAAAPHQGYASSTTQDPSDDEIYRQYIIRSGETDDATDGLHNATTVPILQKLPPGSTATVRPNIRTLPLSQSQAQAYGGVAAPVRSGGGGPAAVAGKPPSGTPRLVSTNVHTTNPYYPKHYINRVTTIPKSHDDNNDV